MLALLLFPNCIPSGFSASKTPNLRDDRGPGESAKAGATTQTRSAASKPEIVLQAGITSPQTQIGFSPDGRLLASMGRDGNAIKLWEVATGRLLRQLESGIPSMGSSSMARPFRFSADGRTLIAMGDGKVRRWEVETGRELSSTNLPTAKDFITAFLSEEGRILAASTMDNSAVRLWDTTAGRELQALTFEKEDHLYGQDSMALSPTGSLVATLTETMKVSRKGAAETTVQVKLWDVNGGRKTETLKFLSGPTQFGVPGTQASLAFSGDGAWLAARNETLMKIWEVATGRELKSFASPRLANGNPSDSSFAMFAGKFIFSPDRRLLSIVSDGRKIDLVDSSSATIVQTLAGHDGAIIGTSFSADSKLLATSGSENQIKVWDVATGRELKTLSGAATPISDIAFSPDGKSLSVAGQQAISAWELVTGGVRRAVSLPDDYSHHRQNGMQERGCLLSRDGRFAIAGSRSQPVAKVWEVATGRELPNVSLTQGKELGNAIFNADGSVLALVERDNQMPGAPRAPAPAQAPTNMPSLPPGGIAMPDMTKLMEQMRKDPKKMQEQMKKVQEAMQKGDMSAGMAVLDSLGVTTPKKNSNSLRILDVATGRQLQAIPQTSGFMNSMMSPRSSLSGSALSFSPDGRILASASGLSAHIILTDVSTGQELRSLKTTAAMNVVSGLAWSADGRKLASAQWGIKGNFTAANAPDKVSFDDMTFAIKVWDTQTGAELNLLAGHNTFVNALAFSRDGRVLASGSYDSTIKLWDLSTGREVRTL
jgi:WD40 repeat protein